VRTTAAGLASAPIGVALTETSTATPEV
jgi:hypothetical protein